MAQAFNLTAQLQLQAPGNTDQVINQIRRQLKPIGVKVNIQNARDIAQANKSLNSFNKNAQASTKSMNQLNRTLQESARRFSVITIATGSFLALANAFKNSTKEAIAFERELVKIAQVTGKSVGQLKSLADEVTRLGTSLGASSSDLLNVARTLTQAGFAAEDTRAALDILAKTSLGATFDNIQDTTEGAIALLRQFTNEARAAGGDIKFLEQSLDAINAVSKAFAVESSDLISVIRRTGGVFAAAGGEINELIALFTSVRATTRESAETIATGLRTIFTRIQRPETITQLREFGVELQDAQGNFVGAFEAFKRLSAGLKSIDPRTTAFSQIVEDLGGFRQVGKVIPLIQQFTTAQQALTVAQNASGSVAKDAETAQQSLGVQIQKVREQFDALIRKFVDSSAFRSLATGGLELAKAFIRIADSLEPLLPMLITLAGLKLGKGLAPALGSFVGIGKSVSGTGPVTKFATGGIVPGTGNRDTVPAMLTPGEFVIRKSSVNKIGAGNLAAMNAGRQKYATGGAVELSRNSATVQDLLYRGKRNISKKRGVDFDKSKNMFTEDDTFTSDISKNTISPQKRVVDRLEPKTKSALLNSKNTAAQGDAFEKYLVESGRMTSPKGFGGNNPFDGKSGNELIEVKRTAVADSILLDKNLRHQLKTGNKLNKSKLSGGSDNIKLPPMTELELNKASVESLAQEYKTAKNKKTKKSDPVENKLGDANFAFGGLVQKYAAGGIIQAKKAGAAILDPEAKNSYAENITVNDVKKEFGRAATGAKFARGKDPFSKRFQATKFDVTTSGLNKETSDKFKTTLNDSLVAGLDYAGASLGADLGVGAVTVDKSTKDNFINSLRAAQIGDAFENILSTFNNKGVFDSAVDPNRPFDFPNGLTSPLADNFDGLPKSFIDAKSSAAAASKENLRGKILDQIKDELIADGIYNDSPLFKAPRKKALGGIIQKFAEGGVAEAQKAAYIFDFDDTLGTTEAKGFKDFNNPKFIENALATRYASLAKRRASQGDDIHVLTARYGSKGIIQAIQNFMSKNGIPTKSVMAVGGAFPNEREPGKRPGTTRKLGTASKKAKILSKLAKNYSNITFLDDNAENLLKAGQVEGVKAVEAEESKLFKKYAKGGAASDTVPALLTPGEFVFNKSAAQSIGYTNLNRMNKHGVQGYASGGAVGVQKYATGTGSLGATSAGTVSFKGVSNVEGAVDRLHDVLNKMGVDIQNQVKVLDTFAKELEKGGKVSDALTKSFKGTDVSVKNLTKAKKEEEDASKKAAKADEAEAKASGKTLSRVDAFGQKLERFRGIANSAQQFVFLGATVGSLASQFLDLEDTTAKAITETLGMATAVVGVVGTIAELGITTASTIMQSSLFTAAVGKMAAATELNTQVTNQNTAAKAGESVGGADINVKGGGKGGKLLGAGLTAAATAAVAFATSMYYFGAKARAEADKFAKEFNDALKRIGEDGTGSGDAAKALKEEMIAREKAAETWGTTTKAVGTATVAAAALIGYGTAAATTALVAKFTAAGTAAGSVVPGIGNLVGAIAGFVVGIGVAAAGYFIASSMIESAAKKEAEAREAQIQNILESISALQELNNSIRGFEKERSEISKTAGLSEERKLDLNLTNLEGLQGSRSAGFQSPSGRNITGQQQAEIIARGAGVSVGEFEGMSQEARQEKLEAAGVEAADAAAKIALFKIAIAESTAEEKRRSLELSESASLFSQALENVDPDASLEDLIKGDTSFARAYKARDKALKEQATVELRAAFERKQAAERQLKEAKASGATDATLKGFQTELDNATTALDASEESFLTYNDRLNEGIEATQKLKQAEIANAERLAQASKELRDSMIETAKTVSYFSDQTRQYQDFQNQQQDRAAVESGGLAGLRASGITEKELTPTINVGRFESEFNDLISTIGDPAIKASVEKAKNNAVSAASALADIYSQSDSIIGAERITPAEAKDLFKGIDLSALGPKLQEQIFAELAKASNKVGGLQFEDLNDLIEQLQTKYGDQVKIADQITQRNQEYLKAYDGYLKEIQDKYDAELAFRERITQTQERAIDSELKARNIIAESLGKDPETVDRAAAQARRNAAAQANLNAAGVSSAAGDIGGLGAERKRLQASVRQLTKDIEAQSDPEAKAALKKEQQEQQIRLKAVNDELARLSNQSDAVNEIFTEMQHNVNTIKKEIEEREKLIEVEKRAREQMFSVLEDFVVGGPEDRQRLGQAAMGVQAAYATGTLQNQSPEQRRATVGLLDQLSDVELMGGMTGKEIKQELVFRDAIQMGFPPEIAKQIATATSKEQQLIDQVKDLKQKLVDVNTELLHELEKLNTNMSAAVRQTDPNKPEPVEPPSLDSKAAGGLVQYRANGGTIFKPKGTDTVPAMLTPGEFVIRKSAVDKVGLGTLQAINNGGDAVGLAKGGVVYRANGSDLPEYSPYYGTDLEKRYKEIDAEAAKARGSSQRSVDIAKGNIKSTGVDESLVDKFSSFFGFASNSQEAVKDSFQERRNAINQRRFGDLLDAGPAKQNGPDIRGLSLRGNKEVQRYENESNTINNVQRAIDDSGIAGVPFVGAAVNAAQSVGYGLRNTDGSLTDDVLHTARNVGVSQINVPGVGRLAGGAVNQTAKMFGRRGAGQVGNSLARSFASQQATGDARGYLLEQLNLAKGGPVYLDDGGSMPHRHPHWDYEGGFTWVSETEKSDHGVPATHRDFGKGGLQQENALDPHMQNLSSSYKTARNIVTGGDLGQGFTDLYVENFTLNPAEIASGVKEQMDDFDEFQIKAGDAAGSSRWYEKIFGSFGGQTKSEKMDAIKKEMDYVAFARENNIKITEKSIPNLLKQDPGALQRHNDAINEAKKQKAEAARDDLASAKANAQFDPEKNLQARKDYRANRLRNNFADSPYRSPDKEMVDRIFDGNSPIETDYYTKDKDGRRVVHQKSTHQGMSNEELYMGLTDKELSRLARDFDPNARAEIDRRFEMNRAASLGSSQDKSAKRAAATETVSNKPTMSSEEFNRKLTERQKADGSFYKDKADKMNAGFGTMGGGDIEDSFTMLQMQQEKAKALADAQKAVDQTIPGSTAYNEAKRKLDELQTPGLAEKNYKADQEAKAKAKNAMSLRATTASTTDDRITSLQASIDAETNEARKKRMQENLENLKKKKATGPVKTSFVGPMPEGEQAPIIRENVNTRRKARLAEQKRAASGEGQKKEDQRQTPEEKQNRARYERILRTQGQAAAQRYAKTAGINTAGEGLIRSFAGYGRNQMMMGGGYGNQMMGGGYGGYGGYGNQMVPFGYIPGSPYNSMLGGGIYNIPRFDKRLMFGNMARFFANGGAAGGDTVPAMLTPGEFVMSKNAVSKYGTGFMQNLNKGKIQGFNKGGAVQYRQAGGGIMNTMAQAVGLDTSKIEGVFSGFVDNFSSVFDNIMGPFNAVAESLRQMSESFGNFTMQHNVNVEGMISLGGLNVDTIKNELSKSIGEMVADEVTKAMDSQNKTFKSN